VLFCSLFIFVFFFLFFFFFFFFNDTATTEIYTLSLHDALPIPTPARSLQGLARRKVGRQRNLLRRRAGLLLPGNERLAVASVMLGGAAECEQEHPARPGVDELPADLRCDPDQLVLLELRRLALDDQREPALEHEVDLLLARV